MKEAVKDRNSEFRTPAFICGDNKDLDGRIVVLRKVDPKNNFIQFHSDIRSTKIKQIKKIQIVQYYFTVKRKNSIKN